MDEVLFHLTAFDGPLDLLLHLIAKNKVNIYDIPIATILEQYLAYIDEMGEFDIEFASEFLTMAAQLVYIKSKMLLPSYEEEPSEDPRARLVEALLEYQRMKSVSEYLQQRALIGQDVITKSPEPVEKDKTYKYDHNADQLIAALHDILKRSGRKTPPPVSAFRDFVGCEKVSVSARMNDIIKLLIEKNTADFLDIIKTSNNRPEIVATFLALLELLRARKIEISQQNCGCMITLADGEIYGYS